MFDEDTYLEDLKSKFKKINPRDYILAYSGGKDSHFLYWFLKVWLLKNDWEMWLEYRHIEIVGINTYMEHPEILNRIRKNSDVVLRSELKPMEIKQKYGSPCYSKINDEFISRYQNGNRSENTLKYIYGTQNGNESIFKLPKKALNKIDNWHKISNKCCDYLKKKPIKQYQQQHNKKTILGVRGGESKLRDSKYTSCFTKDGKFTPIYDLTDELLHNIENKYNIEIPKVYDYVTRTGCMGCIYGRNINKELELLKPNQRKFIINYHKESYDLKGIDYEHFQNKLF